jgi:hypothetical protein
METLLARVKESTSIFVHGQRIALPRYHTLTALVHYRQTRCPNDELILFPRCVFASVYRKGFSATSSQVRTKEVV